MAVADDASVRSIDVGLQAADAVVERLVEEDEQQQQRRDRSTVTAPISIAWVTCALAAVGEEEHVDEDQHRDEEQDDPERRRDDAADARARARCARSSRAAVWSSQRS